MDVVFREAYLEALLRTAAEKRFRRVFLLDSADPKAIRAVGVVGDVSTGL